MVRQYPWGSLSDGKRLFAAKATRYRDSRRGGKCCRAGSWKELGGKAMKSSAIIFLSIAFLSQVVLPDEPDKTKADELFRVADDRPRLTITNDQLKKIGVEVFESKRLKLFTDIDPKVARALPPLVDQAYVEWEEYFGKLPPARDESEFQVNGYLMKDKLKFEMAGLLRDDLPDQFHGRQAGYQFWMMDQPQEYYRRHLLLHEATHAFMQAIPHLDVPYSYLEGMAELFGTH